MKRERYYRLVVTLLGGIGLYSLPPAHAADVARGKALHDAHCTGCHSSIMNGDPTALFTRPQRIVRSFDGLQKRVRFCESMASAHWPEADINDVVAYLNQSFYKFSEQPNE